MHDARCTTRRPNARPARFGVSRVKAMRGDQAAQGARRGARCGARAGGASGAGPQTYANTAGIGSSWLPREITIPTGSISSFFARVVGMTLTHS
jgi:hypothetical protein